MLIRKSPDIRLSEITPRSVFLNRRHFVKHSLLAGAATALGCDLLDPPAAAAGTRLADLVKSPFSIDDTPNSFEDVTTYNNYYEFGTGKSDPAQYAQAFKTHPWKVSIEGEAELTGEFDLDEILKPHPLEERIYRLRCVEAWSMVIPWVGFPLGDLLQRFKPTSRAKYVEMQTLYDPEQMPGQRRRVLDWPYVEGLTIAEAMNPLAIIAVGVYGETLPNQNGAPLRLVVPWKYGFKSVKSIARIRFTARKPKTAWAVATPHEYGFYANVNPKVDHPRWSQARERRIGTGLFGSRQPTLMFNGYAEQVAHLYAGLDLVKNF